MKEKKINKKIIKKTVKTAIYNASSLKKVFVTRESSQGCDFVGSNVHQVNRLNRQNILFRKKKKKSQECPNQFRNELSLMQGQTKREDRVWVTWRLRVFLFRFRDRFPSQA